MGKNKNTPTIKGVFVKSHIDALRQVKGEGGISMLKNCYGEHIDFKYLEDVPVKEEVKILEIILNIITNNSLKKEQHAFEAGRMHFKNFSSTSAGKLILLCVFPKDFCKMMLRANSLVNYVFKNISVYAEVISSHSIKIIIDNSDYPADHLKGFFHEWLCYWGYDNIVQTTKISHNKYECIVNWQKAK